MIVRRWHRWLALPAAVFLLFIGLTGTLLHADMMRLGHQPPGSETPSTAPPAPLPSDAELAAIVARIAAAARAENGMTINTIQINLGGPAITVSAGPGGPPGSPQIKLDARTGRRIVDPVPPADFHYILQDLHAGYRFGWAGRIMSLLSGIALVALSITGLQMWWDMKRRGNKRAFWK